MTEDDLIKLLAVRHSKDVFVAQCKDGPTNYGSHLRLDAWVMRRSWAHPTIYGYEVKVARSDFVRDEKWQGYLEMCNALYFVCPPKMIDPKELPSQVGLLVCSANATRLYCKKKAPIRDNETPENVWRYILMWRAEIRSEHTVNRDREFWEEWLKHRRIDHEFGANVGGAIRKAFNEKVRGIEYEHKKLEERLSKYADLERLLETLGVDGDGWDVKERVKRQAARMKTLFPAGLEEELRTTASRLQRLVAELDRFKAEAE